MVWYGMGDTNQEFSFPVASITQPQGDDSPPLWENYSSAALEESTKTKYKYNNEDEKMDSLWEDFNIGGLSTSFSSKHKSRCVIESPLSGDDMAPFGCTSSCKRNCLINSPTIGIMTLMKRLFLLHHSYHRIVAKN
ncbi:hypothetical protein ACFE04_012299 [Oxalis oulophora]